MAQRWDAVVAGHICLDVTPHFESTDAAQLSEILIPGKLVEMNGVDLSTGGAVPNTGIALAMMGVSTTLMGKVGNDAFGAIVRDLAARRDVSDGLIQVDGVQTSYTIVIVPPGTDRVFLHDPGANNTFVAEDVRYEQVSQARLFHFGYPPIMQQMYADSGVQLARMLRRVKESGVTTSVDMALPDPNSAAGRADWQTIVERSLPHVDIFLPSLEEILYMVDRPRYQQMTASAAGRDMMDVADIDLLPELAGRLHAMGADVVGIKCGKLGFYLSTASADRIAAIGAAAPERPQEWGDCELFCETFVPERILSTTGSGDSSIAGFLAGILLGRSAAQTLRIACAAGANTARVYDTLSGVESVDRMEARIAAGWQRNLLDYRGSRWQFDQDQALWKRVK
ncbi:MAG: carbohydrate kinase family protein [Spirochaetaceae bacterium]|nr:MAG: carbohydrate kinase family protein [Spirochaetaceae bacterium]